MYSACARRYISLFKQHCITIYTLHYSIMLYRRIRYTIFQLQQSPQCESRIFHIFLYLPLVFFPVLNRRDTSVSIDYRTRNGDYAGVVIDQSCTGCIGRVRSSQRTALLHLCGVIFLRFARVQLPVDGYVRVLSSSLGFNKNGSPTRYNRL